MQMLRGFLGVMGYKRVGGPFDLLPYVHTDCKYLTTSPGLSINCITPRVNVMAVMKFHNVSGVIEGQSERSKQDLSNVEITCTHPLKIIVMRHFLKLQPKSMEVSYKDIV